jgi:hypothetical protein
MLNLNSDIGFLYFLTEKYYLLYFSNYQTAVALLRRATTPPARKGDYFDESAKVQMRVFRSLKLWSLYADIEESLGSLESCREIYDRMIELRIGSYFTIIKGPTKIPYLSHTPNYYQLCTFP